MEEMKTFWFKDKESGEEFFVEAEDVSAAIHIACVNFGYNVKCYGTLPEWQAEAMGLDTYTE